MSSGKKITVCHIASGDLWAGAEVQIATSLRALARRSEFALSAIVLNPGRLADEIQRCGIEVKIIPESEKNFFAIASEAAAYLKLRGVRILHSHRYKENVLAALVAWRCGIPFIVRTQHGLSEPFTGLKKLKQQFIQRLDRYVSRSVTNRLVAVSSEMRRELASRTHPGKIVVIPNGVEAEAVRSSLSEEKAKERLGIPRDSPVLGTAGRLEPVKRLDIFLEAARIIAAERPAARFILAGEGSEGPRLRAQAQALGLQDRALFLGHRDDIYDVLRAMDVMVLSSDHEGLPMVLLEAMALGVPVVARAVGGIPEVLVHGASGLRVDSAEPAALAEACRELLANPGMARQLAYNASQRVRGVYSAAGAAEAISRLYNGLAASGGGAR